MAIDCAQHYRALVYKYFPSASVVADKYHILRAADFAIDRIRLDLRGSIAQKRTKLKLKKDKFILKTRERSLTDWERTQLQMWRQDFPILGTAYDLKEEFYRIYDAQTQQEARLRFNTWKNNIPPELAKYFEPILVTWSNWDKEIFEYWNHPITNAYTECQNMLTRAIDRIGRGYSFDALRVKLLLAPKKQGVVTSFRSIRKRNAPSGAAGYFASYRGNDEYEQVPEQKTVIFGVDLVKLENWLESQDGSVHLE